MTDAHGQTVRCFESAKAKKTVLQVERLTLALLLVWKCQKPYCRTRAPGELPIEYSVTRGISKLHEHTTSNQPTNLLTSTSSTTLPWGQNAVGTLCGGQSPTGQFSYIPFNSFFLSLLEQKTTTRLVASLPRIWAIPVLQELPKPLLCHSDPL